MIRFAASEDIARLVEMGKQFHASSIYATKIGFDEKTLTEALASFIASDIAVVLVKEHKGAVIGAIGGIVGPHFVAGGKAASELFWWVDPEYRGVGMTLLDAYEDECASRGARYSGMICPYGNGMVEKLYSKANYSPLETIFYKEMA